MNGKIVLKAFIVLIVLFSETNSIAQKKTTLQVFTYFTAWNIEKYSYKESVTNNRAIFFSRYYPTVGLAAIRTTRQGSFGFGIAYNYAHSSYTYQLDSVFRLYYGDPWQTSTNVSFTNSVKTNKAGIQLQYLHRLNESAGLKVAVNYYIFYSRENACIGDEYLEKWDVGSGDSTYSFTQYNLQIVEFKPLQWFSVFLGGTYQVHPSLEISAGIDYQPFGSLIAERKEYLNNALNSRLQVWDRYLNITLGVSYTFRRKQ
jgi:hypothetical protein